MVGDDGREIDGHGALSSSQGGCAESDSNVRRRSLKPLQLLREFHETFQEAQDLESVFYRVYEMLPRCLGVNRASVLLWDEIAGALVSEKAIGAPHQDETLPSGPQQVGYSISGLAFSEVRPVVVGDCTNTKLIPQKHVEELRLKSSAAVPIVWKRNVIGVLRVDDTENTNSFSDDDIEFLTMIAEQLGGVIQNARLFDDLRRREREIMRINRDLAAAHESAVNADQAKSAFLARVSHELRTPLNAILGYAELLQEEAVPLTRSNTLQHDLERIHTAGRHLLRLIDDLLDLARIEAGKATLRPEKFEIRQLLLDVCDLVRPAIEQGNNELLLNIDGALGSMETDATKLKQVLLNLLGNAAKFTSGGRITLAAATTDGGDRTMVQFCVRDTGMGMSEEQMERLFEAFYQVEQRSPSLNTTPHAGTGLGLAISRHLCRLMGGDIDVDSKPGHGSTFTVRLPFA